MAGRGRPGGISDDAVRGGWWLAQASGDTARARLEWSRSRLVEIPVGIHFDVVRLLSPQLGRAAIEDLRASGLPPGPVMLDHTRRHYYWLVTVESDQEWGIPEGELLVRRPGGRAPQTIPMPAVGAGRVGDREWLVGPDGSGLLTRRRDLAIAIRRTRSSLRPAAAPAP
ncbi:hypothetical protein [Kitasatospora sp. NPDC092286]|uniref:hypothetical protein n=1 Tax=Kitasatospora sp. NPDC092286 TaxID=3364087 RepID=UPI003829DB84